MFSNGVITISKGENSEKKRIRVKIKGKHIKEEEINKNIKKELLKDD
ncbi:hypothetical protein SDC9_08472 [bioreactor metagenome]|uniref:Uncharacterized protein n=1 Tax=bioreactor metagenome TaxID=1076179 RepID=A0A644T9M0_9ZZZZ|nr:hypothetical protein [Methanobrevibacter sp.]MEA4957224.1 hypothetical protein [Methanobrevibacter sp.]